MAIENDEMVNLVQHFDLMHCGEYFEQNASMRMMYYSVSDTSILGKRKSEYSYQESNLRPSDY